MLESNAQVRFHPKRRALGSGLQKIDLEHLKALVATGQSAYNIGARSLRMQLEAGGKIYLRQSCWTCGDRQHREADEYLISARV